MILSFIRRVNGSYVERSDVFIDHQRERQYVVGAAYDKSQLPCNHFLVLHHRNDYNLLRLTQKQKDSYLY